MHPLQSIMIIGITAFLLIGALLLVIRKMPSRKGINWWLISMLTAALSYLLSLIFFESEGGVIGEMIFFILQLSVHTGVVIGTLLFFDQDFDKRINFFLFPVTVLAIFSALLNNHDLLANVFFVAFIFFNMSCLSIRLFKVPNGNKVTKVTAVLYLLVGLHWLNYPFLKGIEWFAPIGFLIGMVLGISMGLSLAVLALLQFEKQTKESEQRAIYAATHDPLTSLYNRSYLDKLFSIYAKEAKAEKNTFAMLYLDLDGFKVVNDTYGHKAGDFLLQVVAKRLTNLLHGRGDAIRIGGDEIVALSRLRVGNSNDHIYGLARKILDVIEQPIVNGKQTYNISASIGVCCYPLHGESLEALLEKTDALMYAAKKGGRRQIKFADFNKKTEASAPLSKLQSAPAMADAA